VIVIKKKKKKLTKYADGVKLSFPLNTFSMEEWLIT
jgi:hypothetical protein